MTPPGPRPGHSFGYSEEGGDDLPQRSVSSWLDRIAAQPPFCLLGLAMLVYAALSLIDMSGESITNDELVHLSAGYTYISKHDFRLNPEHPPLAKMLAALPLRLMNIQWPARSDYWKHGDEWEFGYHFFYQSGNDPERMLFWGRVPMIAWGCALLWCIYSVAASLYGPKGGLVSLVLATFCPTVIAHGHLVTTDVPVATALLTAVIATWKLLQKQTALRTISCGVCLGIALATKFNSVMFLPAFALIGIVAWIRGPANAVNPTSASRLRATLAPVLHWTVRIACIAVLAYGVLWGTYGFRFHASPDPTFTLASKFDPANHSMIAKCITFAQVHRLLPEAYLNGFRYMHEQAQLRDTFAFGFYSERGWWWYFPAAFLVKNPVPTIILVGWGLWAHLRRTREGANSDYFLIIPLIVYGVLAATSNINIGIRHILPIYPVLLILAGGIPLDQLPRRLRWTSSQRVMALLLLNIGGCLVSVPHLLAYFHLPSRLIWKPHEMLSDSNLDWGQDLGALKRYMDRHEISRIKLAYFGNGSPRSLDLQHERLPSPNMYSQYEPEWKEATRYKGGEYVAISAVTLMGVLWPESRYFYLQRFGYLTPVDSIGGGSILIYRVPDYWDQLPVGRP